MINHSQNRRQFIKHSLTGAAGLFVLPTILPSRVIANPSGTLPNDKINMGFIGVGGMGSGHLRTFLEFEDVRVVAICDVRKEHRDNAQQAVMEKYQCGAEDCKTYNDFRELLARPDIDAVLMACPDHWHVLIGMEAAERGIPIYYEKPASYTVEEAKKLRETFLRTGTVFQFGTQQRSSQRFRHAVELVRNGYLGELKQIVIGSASYTEVPEQPVEPVPEGLDYDFWQGPRPERPYTTLRCTRNWTLIREYSLGCLSGAWGIHHIDIAQWALDADQSGPVFTEGTGSKPETGLYDTFQRFNVEHAYANGMKVNHVDHPTAMERFKPLGVPPSNAMGIWFEGSDNWVYVSRDFVTASDRRLWKQEFSCSDIRLPVSNNHRRNFLEAVRNGTPTICPVETAVKSEMVCQQADIALSLGRKLEWDNDHECFVNDSEANSLLARPMRSPWHL